MEALIDDAVEILEGGSGLLLSCEHASNSIPAPLEPTEADRLWLDTHWAWDPGAPTVTRHLVERCQASAVLARFSRLVCDPNRSLDDPTWIVGNVEGHDLSFNRRVPPDERRRRLQRYYAPYHSALDVAASVVAGRDRPFLLSIHSFTPNYLGQDREMELGILFDDHEPLAESLRQGLGEQGFRVAMNAPYSGRNGRMYSATRHGRGNGLPYLELELRQDLAQDIEGWRQIAEQVLSALRAADLVAR
jgi:predicted N-formylglutamate amidohydrolase